jgi:hypothetical protein
MLTQAAKARRQAAVETICRLRQKPSFRLRLWQTTMGPVVGNVPIAPEELLILAQPSGCALTQQQH